jgi:hypothetical protein
MVEYRLKEKRNVHELYQALENAWVKFKFFPIMEDQHPEGLRGIEFSENGDVLRGPPFGPTFPYNFKVK